MGGGFCGLGCLAQQLSQILQLLRRHFFPQLHHPLHVLSPPQCLSLQPSCSCTEHIPLWQCHLLSRLRGCCLFFPNFHIPSELIHHLPITSLPLCHLILQPFPSKLLLLCPCFHSRKLVSVCWARVLTCLSISLPASCAQASAVILEYLIASRTSSTNWVDALSNCIKS